MQSLPMTRDQGVVVVALPADLGQHDYLEMRAWFGAQLFQRGEKRVVLDCAAAEDPPSIAYGVFCGLSRDVQRAGCGFGLVGVSARVRTVMARTHVDQQLRIWKDIAEAATALAVR